MFTKLFTLLIALAFTMLSSTNLFCKGFDIAEFKESLPQLLGAGNAGQEFWLTFNPCWETENAGNSLKLYVSSAIATTVTVEVPGKEFRMAKMTIPNDIIEFTLPPPIGQCYRKTDREVPLPDSVFRGYGIHVYADYPIICYGLTRYKFTSDGYLGIPVSALGKEYTVASWADVSDYGIQYLPSYSAIVSAFDQTEVSFTLGGTYNTRTSGGLMPGETRTVILNKGDVFLVSSAGQRADLTGSQIISTKPVSVISSNFCAYVPENTPACDFLTEMEIPSSAWGKEYHYTPIVNRTKNSIIKILAKEPETTIYSDNVPIVKLKKSSGTETDGWLRMRADVNAPRPIVFSGDKPIYIMQYNTGQIDDFVNSDPFQMALTPIEQYQKEIIFNTPGIKSGFRFLENYVNVVYQSPSGNIPDDLLFAQVIDGQFTWKKVYELNLMSTQRFSIPVNGIYYNVTTIKLPDDGVFKLKSNEPIAAYAYGFAPFDSYGFPASAAIGDLSKADKIPPDPKFAVYGNGKIEGGSVEDMPQSADRSNLSMIVFHRDESENYDFNYNNFIPGNDSYTSWSASVIDSKKDARLVATFADRRGNDTTIVVNYYSPKYTFSSDVDFGTMKIGSEPNGEFTINNNSDNTETFSDVLVFKNGNMGFDFTDSPNIVFTPGAETKVGVKFIADKVGEFRDSIGFRRGGNDDEFFIEVRATVVKTTSVDDENINTVEITQSSNNDWLYIKLIDGTQLPESIKLFDLFGNAVYVNNNINEKSLKINTSGLANGMYFIQIGTDRVSTFKVMVSR
ncbi:MAG: T9SS type A sorting domain-containing protein [Bacteroidetes bacterium]|nr:MAG: T9SS type A sorting domain-containing protein [Bacteroidota bacterium]